MVIITGLDRAAGALRHHRRPASSCLRLKRRPTRGPLRQPPNTMNTLLPWTLYGIPTCLPRTLLADRLCSSGRG